MPAVSSCPDAQALQRLLLGQLIEAQADTYVRHLAECERCVQTLNDLKVSDTLLDALRAASASTLEKPVSQEVATLIERFRRIPAAAAPAEASTQNDRSQPVSASDASAATLAPSSQSDDSS